MVILHALIGVGHIDRVKGYDAYPNLAKMNPIGSLNRLSVVLIITAFFCLFIWLTTFRRWRSGAFILSVALLALGVVLITSDGFIFRGARATEKWYLENWKPRMNQVHKDSIEAFGCPNKYSGPATWNANDAYITWETDNNKMAYENKACAQLLAEMYAVDYYDIANLGLMSAGYLVLVGAGFYYFWYVAKHELHTPNNIEYVFLGLLAIITICVSLGVGVKGTDLIKEYVGGDGAHA